MKAISNHSTLRTQIATAFLFLTVLILVPLTIVHAAMTTEDFETEAIGTTFTENTLDFSVTGDLTVTQFNTYGCCPSNRYLDTGFQDGDTVGSAGTIQITTANHSFRLGSFDVWTSDDGGAYDVDGNVTFIGTLKAGGTETETFLIEPTGYTGTDWDHVDFSGTSLDGADIVALEIRVENPVNFVALDNFEFEGLDPTAIKLQSRSAEPNMKWAHFGILLLLITASASSVVILYRSRSLFSRK